MKIAFGNHVDIDRMSTHNGYGYATSRIVESLRDLGHIVENTTRFPGAQVNLWFDMPHFVKWNPGQYRILYTPWESTELRPGWLKIMNTADEVWTPSPTVAQWYADAGVKPPIYVFEHGVDSIWHPRGRLTGERFRFLHHGAEALRKGAQQAIGVFLQSMREEDATLCLKCNLEGFTLFDTPHIEINNKIITIEELVDYYYSCDAMLYNTQSEGFGLPGLQAIATGMPVIAGVGVLPYEDFIHPELLVKTTMVDSPWPREHPGQVFKLDDDDLTRRMKTAYYMRNDDDWHAWHYKNARQAIRKYNWTKLTEEAFQNLEKRL